MLPLSEALIMMYYLLMLETTCVMKLSLLRHLTFKAINYFVMFIAGALGLSQYFFNVIC